MASRLVLVLLLVIFMLKGADSCTNPFEKVGEKCIFFADTLTLNQDAGQQICLALHGRLLQITHPQDFTDLVDYMHNNATNPLVPYWMDGSDSLGEGLFLYSSGDQVPMGTPFWGTWSTVQEGESQYPNEDINRNCIGLSSTEYYFFKDIDCEELRSPLCEETEVSKLPQMMMEKSQILPNFTELSEVSKLPQMMMKKSQILTNFTELSEVSKLPQMMMEKSEIPPNFVELSEDSKVSPDLKTVKCDNLEDLTDPTGTIYSPGWPGRYPNNLDCWWSINLYGKGRVKISFASFDLQSYYDTLTIWDSLYEEFGTMLGRFEGNHHVIPDILSTGQHMSLYFRTDSTDQHKGFEIHWEAVDMPSCDEEYTSPEGQLYSPDFPREYAQNLDCQYKITTGDGTTIRLTFAFFETHDSQDYLKVYDGGDSSASLIMTLSGTQHDIPVISSSTNQMFLTFKTNDHFSAGGFDMFWISEMACPLPFVKVGSMCLKFLFADLTFGQATVSCIADGGTLAAIKSAEELRDFFMYINQYGIADADYWIGGSDQGDEEMWTWQDGSLVPMGTPFWGTFGSNATEQEPNGATSENCLALNSDGAYFFRDQDCTSTKKAVCMYEK